MLDRHAVASEPGPCPVSDLMMARIYSAREDELVELAYSLPEMVRADVAAFCYRHLHLREAARRIASLCEPVALARSGAHPGLAVLLAAKDDAPDYSEPNIALAPDEVVREWAAFAFD